MIAPARIQFLKERIARFNDQQAYLSMGFWVILRQ